MFCLATNHSIVSVINKPSDGMVYKGIMRYRTPKTVSGMLDPMRMDTVPIRDCNTSYGCPVADLRI